MTRTYKNQFPGFPVADMPAIPAGWDDVSWRNEFCPHFVVRGTDLHVWVDYADAGARELPDTRRFSVTLHSADDVRDLIETDDWADVLAYVGAWETVVNGLELPESTYAAMREDRMTRADALALKSENDAAAKPCPDLAAHLARVLNRQPSDVLSAALSTWANGEPINSAAEVEADENLMQAIRAAIGAMRAAGI